jgi:RNA polymerase sigma-70 factor (ECF subfamily)
MTIDAQFHDIVVPHLEAGRRLARWMVRNDDDAEDVVQEASLRALRYFDTFTGGDGRAWFLRIVRNTSFGWHRRQAPAVADLFDEESHSHLLPGSTPESLLLQIDDASRVTRAMERLPRRARELLRLRELEGLTYRELAAALDIPLGTVMSGLARARAAFRDALANEDEPC